MCVCACVCVCGKEYVMWPFVHPRTHATNAFTLPPGQLRCWPRPLDCKPSPWSEYSVCTKTCTCNALEAAESQGMEILDEAEGVDSSAMEAKICDPVPGLHTSTRRPEAQYPCALGGMKLCRQSWGGGRACSSFRLVVWVYVSVPVPTNAWAGTVAASEFDTRATARTNQRLF